MRRTRIITTLAIGAFVVIAGSRIGKLRGQGTINQAQNSDDVTTIQEGVMTEKQRIHSKLYKGYRFPKPIRERGGKPEQFKVVIKSEPVPRTTQSLSCDADAIVIGVVQSKASQLTEDRDFVFTDYEIRVEDVWKNSAQTPVEQGALFTLTRPGGAVRMNGKVFTALDESFSALKPGRHYVLFLRYIPETGSYRALNSASTFADDGGKIIQMRTDQIRDFSESGLTEENFKNVVLVNQAACGARKGTN